MSEKLKKYLDSLFSPYEDLQPVKELKEELLIDLQEKLNDLQKQGYDDEAAYRMTISSIGDISEIIDSITEKTRELKQTVLRDFSETDLRNSDFKGVTLHNGNFKSCALKGSDFSGSDLTNSSFNSSDLRQVTFDCANLTGAKLTWCDLRGATFNQCILTNTDFSYTDLSGICFDNQIFTGTVFDFAGLKGTSFKNAVFRNVSFKTKVKDAIFDGATMDKLTYAILKGYKANLTNVTVI
ncbi:pentapeptide repeat-containing protein [Lihuaxuella thermophila]|uniref:Pentapeptide repeat-containing protein n=1 Tax=Lihuaxuella thermophila TaxID=1173111 RepID=A0A1H8ILA6_9BACL|nr:pentapeptide repeat-containing protein [Lihuaxuella thermophila]SEN68707.1 Pentapeptide repeat-containing protein [Lihuaxuella thermophila]